MLNLQASKIFKLPSILIFTVLWGSLKAKFKSDIAAKLITLSDSDAGGFYAEHEGKPFYNDLIAFMTSGPVFIQVLEGEDAIAKNRELMGNTDPSKADVGTIRADFAQTIDANAVHGSDSEKSASREIAFFFSDL